MAGPLLFRAFVFKFLLGNGTFLHFTLVGRQARRRTDAGGDDLALPLRVYRLASLGLK